MDCYVTFLARLTYVFQSYYNILMSKRVFTAIAIVLVFTFFLNYSVFATPPFRSEGSYTVSESKSKSFWGRVKEWFGRKKENQSVKEGDTKQSTTKKAVVFKDPGGRVDWSKDGVWIAFDKQGADGYSDVYLSKPDGSSERCLTCNNPKLPKHNGNPAFSPDGNYIVFQAQTAQPKSLGGKVSDSLAAPGRGVYNNLWVTTSSGSKFWQLTDIKSPTAFGVLHPHFSHDGKKLFWAQRVGSGGSMGTWALKVAEFSQSGNSPTLFNIKTFQPGPKPRFYESHGFSLDDTKIIFSGNPDNQSDTGFDIYIMDLATGTFQNLTNTPNDWDEHAQLSPDGSKIVWVSSQGSKKKNLNLWMMNADGLNKKMILDKDASIGDNSWSPDSKRLVFYLITNAAKSTGTDYILKL